MPLSRIACVSVLVSSLVAASSVSADEPAWTYAGEGGPAEWGELDPGFATCSLGLLQSPIDIRDPKVAELPPIRFDYRPSPLRVIDNGHTIQVNFAPGSSIVVGGESYTLLQMHFHKPSEERIAGKAYAMVAHLVHRDAAGRLAVVAVLLEPGAASAAIATLWENLPAEKGKESAVAVMFDAAGLLPAERGYFTFEGSLTTPPCSEQVRWFVLKAPVSLDEAQVAAFARRYPMNARPVQPLHGRAVLATP